MEAKLELQAEIKSKVQNKSARKSRNQRSNGMKVRKNNSSNLTPQGIDPASPNTRGNQLQKLHKNIQDWLINKKNQIEQVNPLRRGTKVKNIRLDPTPSSRVKLETMKQRISESLQETTHATLGLLKTHSEVRVTIQSLQLFEQKN